MDTYMTKEQKEQLLSMGSKITSEIESFPINEVTQYDVTMYRDLSIIAKSLQEIAKTLQNIETHLNNTNNNNEI